LFPPVSDEVVADAAPTPMNSGAPIAAAVAAAATFSLSCLSDKAFPPLNMCLMQHGNST